MVPGWSITTKGVSVCQVISLVVMNGDQWRSSEFTGLVVVIPKSNGTWVLICDQESKHSVLIYVYIYIHIYIYITMLIKQSNTRFWYITMVLKSFENIGLSTQITNHWLFCPSSLFHAHPCQLFFEGFGSNWNWRFFDSDFCSNTWNRLTRLSSKNSNWVNHHG